MAYCHLTLDITSKRTQCGSTQDSQSFYLDISCLMQKDKFIFRYPPDPPFEKRLFLGDGMDASV